MSNHLDEAPSYTNEQLWQWLGEVQKDRARVIAERNAVRAEAEWLKQQRDAAEKFNTEMHENCARMMRERDAARAQLAEMQQIAQAHREDALRLLGERDAARAQIEERDALLREFWEAWKYAKDDFIRDNLLQRIEAALEK